MASRVLLQRRTVAPFLAAATAGGALLFPSVAHAEAPSQEDWSKKPIYDDYEVWTPKPNTSTTTTSSSSSTASSTTLVPSSTTSFTTEAPEPNRPHGPTPTDRLAVEIGKARLFLYKHATRAEDSINAAMDRAFHLERSFTSTIASLAPSRESGERLMPGLVYVLVAGMAGSIMTRSRNVVLRATVPVALGIGAGWVVVPVTMGNVSALLWTYEQRFPAVASAHVGAREGVQRGWHWAKVHSDWSRRFVDEKVTNARDLVEGWVKKGK